MTIIFVWDLHGTLERGTIDACLDISNDALARLGYEERFTRDQINSLFGRKWAEMFNFLLPNAKPDDINALMEYCRVIDAIDVLKKYVQPNEHARLVLSIIHDCGHDQILISNTWQDTVDKYVDILDFGQFFHIQYACEGRKSKLEVLSMILRYSPRYDKLVIVGDSEGDVALGKVEFSGEKIVYQYTYPDRPVTKMEGADHLITDLRDVLEELL